MYVGVDDTDSYRGMCTTYLGLIIVNFLKEQGVDIIGYPRLVRLNPNIPWKTRGNGAICIRYGKGKGKKIKIGEFGNEKIFAYENLKREIEGFEEEIVKEIKDYFMIEDKKTNPGIVFSRKKLPEKIYWRGVREIVNIKDVEKILKENNAKYYKFKNGRGIIGASSAISWRARRYTYELLTYLPREKWEKERKIDEKSVIFMDKNTRYTFDNYDYENKYVAIKPNSKTPVLYGIRGLSPHELIEAKDMIESDDYEGFLIYKTNQATDEHLRRMKIGEMKKYKNGILRGKVSREPRKIEGGHVIFKLRDSSGEIYCGAYEPTKNFRDVIMQIYKGDEVEVYGGIGKYENTVNIEKIRILKTTEMWKKVENPICPKCGRRMESIGKGKGYRCRKCGIKLPESAAKYEKVERIKEGWYEVPIIARRHLSMPIKLILSSWFQEGEKREMRRKLKKG